MHLKSAKPLNILGDAMALTGERDLLCVEFYVSLRVESFYNMDYRYSLLRRKQFPAHGSFWWSKAINDKNISDDT